MSNHYLTTNVLIFISFILGSIPTGYLLARLYGVDIRAHGSGNIGATNVSRILGKKLGAVTFAVDVLKGVIATLLGTLPYRFSVVPQESLFSFNFTTGIANDLSPMLGVIAIFGHCFTPFLGFKGGKGVATALGVFLLLAPIPTAIAFLTFLVLVKWSKIVSLGSITSALALPILVGFGVPNGYIPITVIVTFLTTSLVMIKHLSNLRRLLQGKELVMPQEFVNDGTI